MTTIMQPSLFKKAIPNFPDYEADILGGIYAKNGDAFLKPRWIKGYLSVDLYRLELEGKETVKVTRSVHTLILETFKSFKPDPAYQGRHLDGNVSNNFVGNLEWGTATENGHDRVLHGTSRKKIGQKGTRFTAREIFQIRKLRQRDPKMWTMQRLAEKYKTCTSQIHYVVSEAYWPHIKVPQRKRKPQLINNYIQLELRYEA